MGISDRKQRHKEELKDLILQGAKELFLEKGFDATSMRNIAERIEYSPATIYLHYRDKSEVFYDLHREGFKLLMTYFSVLGNVADPFERLRAMGSVYVNFAMENPDFYKLMFVMDEPMCFLQKHAHEEWDEGEDSFRFLHMTVVQCQERGYFKGLDPMGVAFTVWSTVHGLCTLRTSGHLDHVRQVKTALPDIQAVTDMTMKTFIDMLDRLK